MIDMWKVRDVQSEVMAELIDAWSKYGDADGDSAHEAWAILREEVDELWDVIKLKGSRECMREEAIQVAAMAIRFIMVVCDRPANQRDEIKERSRRAATESGNARSADPTPPASQRTSPSEVPQSPVSVPHQEWPAVASSTVESDPSDPSRVIVRHKQAPYDEGPLVQNAGRPPHSSPLDRMGAQQLLTPKLLISPDQQEEWEKST